MRMFPKLGERTVKIQVASGKVYEVDKLGIGDADKVSRIIDEVSQKSQAAPQDFNVMIEGAKQLAEIAAQVMPEELKGDLFRLGYAEISGLVLHLLYGTEDGEDADGKKKAPEETETEEE